MDGRGGFVSIVLALAVGTSAAAQEHEHPATAGEKLGTVQFATSCSAAAQPQFDRAVALLHSFEFGDAIEGSTRRWPAIRVARSRFGASR